MILTHDYQYPPITDPILCRESVSIGEDGPAESFGYIGGEPAWYKNPIDVTPDRSQDTVYQNETDRAIFVSATFHGDEDGTFSSNFRYGPDADETIVVKQLQNEAVAPRDEYSMA